MIIGLFVHERYAELTRKTVARVQIEELENAFDHFHKDTLQYPMTAEGFDALVHNPRNLKGWKGAYLKNIPLDPWGRAYLYKHPGHHSNYDIYSCGPDRIAGTDDDIVNWEIPK
jgi:general secretion pathway protein G